MAHVGAMRAMAEAGIHPTRFVGTSMGAAVATGFAAGLTPDDMEGRLREIRRRDVAAVNPVALAKGLYSTAILRAEPLRDTLARLIPVQRFAELTHPLTVTAADMDTGELVLFGADGEDAPLIDALYASCALPLFYPPAEIDGELYVDGGVMDPLPVERAAERGADLILAIDVGAGPVKDSKDTVSKGMVAVHHRVFDIMAYSRKRALLDSWSGPPLVYVRPRLDGYSTFDFDNQEYFLQEGHRATREAIERMEVGLSENPVWKAL
jgi:NTE family protein